jgi:hypothetical protein
MRTLISFCLVALAGCGGLAEEKKPSEWSKAELAKHLKSKGLNCEYKASKDFADSITVYNKTETAILRIEKEKTPEMAEKNAKGIKGVFVWGLFIIYPDQSTDRPPDADQLDAMKRIRSILK